MSEDWPAIGGPPVRRGRRGVAACVLLVGFALLFANRVRESALPDARFDLDEAWKVSLAERFERGEIAGRDFFYTYGPATQLVTWIATRLHEAHDPLAAAPLADLSFVLINLVLLGVVLLRFETGAVGAALALGLLAALRVPEHYASFRALLVACAALAAGAALAARSRKRTTALGATAGAVVVAAQLVSADLLALGALAVATTLAAWSGLRLYDERRLGFPWSATVRELLPEVVPVALASAAAVLLGNVAVAAFCAPAAGWLGYHRDLAAMVRGYALAMGHFWELDPGRTCALALALLFLLGWAARDAALAGPRERAKLVGLFAAAVVCARSAFTRSDLGHIALAFTPAALLLAVLVALEMDRRRRLGAAPLVATLLFLAGWPIADIGGPARAIGAVSRFGQVQEQLARLRETHVERRRVLQAAAAAAGTRSRLGAVAARLDGEPLAVIPWENHLAIALGSPLRGEILQAYAAHTPEVQRAYLDALRAEPSARVLLAVDGLGTRPLEGVATATRLPVLVRALLEEYEPIARPEHGSAFLLLGRRREARRLRAVELPLEPRASDRGIVAALPATPCRLLALSLETEYPPAVALVRPEPLVLEVRSKAGTLAATRVVPLRSGDPFEILVPLLPPRRFGELWSSEDAASPEPRELVLARAASSLAAAPSHFELRGASCLTW